MPNIIDILARAQSLMNETALNSITPPRAGGIMYDTLLVLNQMQLEGASLLISKVYASVSAMEADTTPTSDLTGRALKPGQLVVIVTSDSSSSDMGSEYRYNGPGSWTYVGKVGGLPLDTVPTQSSTKGITSGGVYTALAAMKAEGYKYMGLATPGSGGTSPGTPNQPVFYIAGPGSYPNFGSITVASGYLGFIKYSGGSWSVESVAVGKDYDQQLSEIEGEVSQLEAEVNAPVSDLTEIAQYNGYYINKSNGELVAGAGTSVVREYTIEDTSYIYLATGKFGANSSTCLVAYYKADGTFLSSQFPSTGTATDFDHEELTVPSNCGKIRVFGGTPSPMPQLSYTSGSLNQRITNLENEFEEEIGVSLILGPDSRYSPYYIDKATGNLVSASPSSYVNEYNITDATKQYLASGRIGTNTSTCLVCYYTSDGVFISSQYGSNGTAITYTKKVLKVPSNCGKIRVFGYDYRGTIYPAELYVGETLSKKVERLEELTDCKNQWKSVGVFGGSLSVNAESQTAKDIWRKRLGVEITDYGVSGAGFSSLQGTTSIQAQVDGATSKDIYILWASTNDYRNNRECGVWSDYTAEDNYDSSKLVTQCGGINYCIKKLLTINPNAEIYFFTPCRFFISDDGYNPFSENTNATGKNFADYIAEMKKCCDYYGIPVLDQFDLQGVNIFNKSLYYKTDNLHMKEAGYEKIGWVQADFLANGE